jgi:putative restriction endonuclease
MPVTTDLIVDALSSLGGTAHLDEIVRRVTEIAPPPLPADVGASVRARIQERCSETQSFKGREDLFFSVHGVDARRGFWGLREDVLSPISADGFQDGADSFIEDEEGRAALRIHLRRERSRRLVDAFKRTLKHRRCAVCAFDFDLFYGRMGCGYIEAHHTIPVSLLREGGKTKLADLIAVCANCHRVIHRNNNLDWRLLRDNILNKTRV